MDFFLKFSIAARNRHFTRLAALTSFILVGIVAVPLIGLIGCVAVPEAGSDAAGEDVAVVVTKADYIGSEACADCHEDISSRWEKTLHARMLQDPKKNPDAILGDMTQSLPFSEEDIVYTIGNHWTQRYITEIDGGE